MIVMILLFIVNDIRNLVFGLVKVSVYGFYKSRKQKFVMSFTVIIVDMSEMYRVIPESFRRIGYRHTGNDRAYSISMIFRIFSFLSLSQFFTVRRISLSSAREEFSY